MRKVLLALVLAAVAVYAGVTHAAGGRRAATSSEHVSVAVTVSGPELSRAATIRLEGAVDNERRVAAGTVDLSDVAGAIPFHLPVTNETGVIDASHGLVLYAQVPDFARPLVAGHSWVKVDAGALAREQGVDVSSLVGLAFAPQQFVPTVSSFASSTSVLDAGTIDGVHVTHSRLVVDVTKLASLAPPAQRDEVAQCIAQAIADGAPATVPVDVWVDAAGLLRRATLSVSGPDGGHADVDVHLSGYGSSVSVKVPSEADTTDLTQLVR